MTNRTVLGIAVTAVMALAVWGGITLYQNRSANAAEPTMNLPAGYLRASPSFLREFDAAVAEQDKFQKMVQHLNGRIPQGYQFDQQFRAMKPLPPPSASTPVPGVPQPPKPEPKKP